MASPLRITVWNEFIHERQSEAVGAIYPQGLHEAIAAALGTQNDFLVRTATLHDPDQGLPPGLLENTDVLFWWGHAAHEQVADELVTRVQARVLSGMGFVALHSGHHSKVFKRLMGTTCSLCWREAGEKERVWLINPSHPIAEGIPDYIELESSEMYGEPFAIPSPEELIFISWFQGGEVFRSGCCWNRGAGRVFYFSPGHETYPIYHDPIIQRVLINAARWAAPRGRAADVPRHTPVENAREPLQTRGPSVHGPGGVLPKS